jgi:hypothetical protein
MLDAALPAANASNAAFVAGSAGFGSSSTVAVVVVVNVLVVDVLVVDVLVVDVLDVVVDVLADEVVVPGCVVVGVGVCASPADDVPAHPATTSNTARTLPRETTRKWSRCTMATVPGAAVQSQDSTRKESCEAMSEEPGYGPLAHHHDIAAPRSVASDRDELGAERRPRTAAIDGA